MGGQDVSPRHGHCHRGHRFRSPGGDPSCCCCCCCSRWRFESLSPSYSEPELVDRAAIVGGIDVDDDRGDRAHGGEHGGGVGGGGGEACSYCAGVDVAQAEPSVDEASGHAWAYTEVEIARRRGQRTYLELLRSYHDGGAGRLALLEQAKDAILRYTPGKWIECVGGADSSEYNVPITTTLLLVGPRGSGKSALVNRMSRFLEDNPLLPDRAQVFHNNSMQEYTTPKGTNFLQEYMIPRDSASFCVYDTHGLSMLASENFHILGRWMNNGVRHGEMISRNKDFSLKSKQKAMAQDMQCSMFVRRRVNFVIFVVDGISVLKAIDSLNKDYTNLLVETFNYTFMSFQDNKPVVVVTHGDLLSFHERALVCTHLGELLGVPATKQIFDIPDLDCLTTKLAILDLLRYSLEQADRNVPYTTGVQKGMTLLKSMEKQWPVYDRWIVIIELVLIFICAMIALYLRSWRSILE